MGWDIGHPPRLSLIARLSLPFLSVCLSQNQPGSDSLRIPYLSYPFWLPCFVNTSSPSRQEKNTPQYSAYEVDRARIHTVSTALL
ncbi:MAG: hypothetical protein JOS17DRAFT_762493 [Linnemannia elongata]|nr:MAG: hypothetical protein JOS17DRAFT_762493 [Linnemannia elongata]